MMKKIENGVKLFMAWNEIKKKDKKKAGMYLVANFK